MNHNGSTSSSTIGRPRWMPRSDRTATSDVSLGGLVDSQEQVQLVRQTQFHSIHFPTLTRVQSLMVSFLGQSQAFTSWNLYYYC